VSNYGSADMIRFDKALILSLAKAGKSRIERKLVRLLWTFLQKHSQSTIIWGHDIMAKFTSQSDLPFEAKFNNVWFGKHEEIVHLSPPVVLGAIPEMFRDKIGKWSIGTPYLYVLRDVRLLGPFATGYTDHYSVIGETIAPENYDVSKSPPSLVSLLMAIVPFQHLEYLSGSYCSLVSLWSKGYFHWVIECLPRLHVLEISGVMNERSIKFIIDAKPTKWQVESLSLLGLSTEDLIPWNGRGALVRSLVVPSFPRRLCTPGRRFSCVSPESLRWLRDRILSNLGSTEGYTHKRKRIMISRRLAAGRRVLNEDEVMHFLKKLGFELFCLETMSFSEQVFLFSNAEVVIGPHGAGLSNIVFSESVKVIELFADYINPSFYTLATSLGFQYGCLKCKEVKNIHPHRSDMIVNIIQLERLLNMMGVS